MNEAEAAKEMQWSQLEEVNGGWRFTVGDSAGARKFTIPFVRRDEAWGRYWEMVGPAYKLWRDNKRDTIAFSLSQWCKAPRGAEISLSRSRSQPEPKTPLVACSFCGKSRDEAKQLVAGKDVYICDDCVDSCAIILSQKISEHWRWRIKDQEENTESPLRQIDKVLTQLSPYEEHGGLPKVLVENLVTIREFSESNEDRLKRIERKLDAIATDAGLDDSSENRGIHKLAAK